MRQYRITEMEDALYIQEWLSDPQVFAAFPLLTDGEYQDAAIRWAYFSRCRSSLTVLDQGTPCGVATLYFQPYQRLQHQCEMGILIAPTHRGQGIGGELMDRLFYLAKETFKIEILHLQVYENNPAIRLYTRKGFSCFGRQDRFVKDLDGTYHARLLMEKYL